MKDGVARELLYQLANMVENLELMNPPAVISPDYRKTVRLDLVLLINKMREAHAEGAAADRRRPPPPVPKGG